MAFTPEQAREAARKRHEARVGAPESTPEPAEAPPPPLEQLLALVSDLSQQVASLKAQMGQQQQAVPTFKPMEREQPVDATARIKALRTTGEMADGEREQLPVGVNGRRIPENLLHVFGAQYAPGTRVRIRRDATREGAAETWGAVLDRVGASDVGVVVRRMWVGKLGQWKYRVRVDGLTRAQGDGFYSYELEGAA